MAFQVNPKEAHVPEDEYKVGVAAYEAGQDPEAAIAKYRGEKAAEVTAQVQEDEDPTPELPPVKDPERFSPPSAAKATTRPRVVR